MVHPVQTLANAATFQTVQSLHTEPGRFTAKRLMRGLVAVFATVALVFGGSVIFSGSAHAAPGDPVVFPDQALADAVNAELSQNPGDTITEAQAASLTALYAPGLAITDLAGIEYLTGLDRLGLDDNEIISLTPLTGLTNLTELHLSRNQIVSLVPLAGMTDLGRLDLYENNIVDVSPLAGLTALETLDLGTNEIVDVSPLAGLTNLTELRLLRNSIVDVSPLAGLINLETLYLFDQAATVPAAGVDAIVNNPVVNIVGAPIAVTSTDTNFSFDPAANTWTFDGTGAAKTMTWSTQVSIGSVADEPFNGTITQDIFSVPPSVTPENPVVVQAVCVDGEATSPTITLPESTDAIAYDIDGVIEAGATVTIVAGAVEGYVIEVPAGSDWVLDSSRTLATLEITLDTVECDVPPVVDPPVVDPPAVDDQTPVTKGDPTPVTKPNTNELAKTGADQPVALFVGFGALLALAGTALLVARRRMTTR